MKNYTIISIFRENLPNAFGVWENNRPFGLAPLAIFETEAEAAAFVAKERSK